MHLSRRAPNLEAVDPDSILCPITSETFEIGSCHFSRLATGIEGGVLQLIPPVGFTPVTVSFPPTLVLLAMVKDNPMNK